ncbi:MAG: 3-hydroxy-5-phosphonooxypentane-2,4-dione thiolase [Phycisphaerae bacterium]|nr:3-hydroxy-5-phosphonooxypentane-2,4-dione thiolase [Phycisphaerae bacterium]
MVDVDVSVGGMKNYAVGVPMQDNGFFLRGSGNLDWGMKNRLAQIFDPNDGKTVMLAFDHGYIMGPTTGLERIDLVIPPLEPYVDCLMCSRGILRTSIMPTVKKPIAMRCSSGASILKEMSNEIIGIEIEDAIRMNSAIITTQAYIGGECEKESLANMSYLINQGNRYGIPTMGITAVGKDMVRDARYFGLATRILAELGCHVIKSYFIEDGFDEVVAACPVPIVIAGGKKIPELDALTMCYKAIDQGAAGVDMGRNIFMSDSPLAMVQAIQAVVHKNMKPEQALEMYNDLKAQYTK